MDVPGVLRWLVGANIAIAKAMPLVSTLAAAGVMNPDDIAKLDDGALSAAITDKASLRKVRSKILGPHADKGKKRAAASAAAAGGSLDLDNTTTTNNVGSSGGNKRVRASPPSSAADKQLQAAKERAPAPPECSMSDLELASIEFKINRSPVMVLWAAEMAQRLSFDWSTSVTVGRAVADWLAARKGTYLGVMEVDEAAEQAAMEQTDDLPTRTLEIMGQDFTLRQTEGGWRAISKGKLVSATRAHAFLSKVYGDNFGPVRAALRALAAAVPQHQAETTTRAMALYESFRPEVPKGKAGWGQNGMFRLARVMELRDQLLQEASYVKASGPRTGKHEFP